MATDTSKINEAPRIPRKNEKDYKRKRRIIWLIG
jgi:hypothetical protein